MFKKALHFPNHIFWSHWVPSKCQASKLKLRSNSILCGALAHFYDEGKAKGRSKGRPSEYDDLWCQSHSIPSKRIWKYVLFMHVAFKVASHNLCKITKCMPQQVVLTSWRLHLRFICDPKWPEQRVCRVSKNVVAFALSAIALDSWESKPKCWACPASSFSNKCTSNAFAKSTAAQVLINWAPACGSAQMVLSPSTFQ
jgi:hypothetical protein